MHFSKQCFQCSNPPLKNSGGFDCNQVKLVFLASSIVRNCVPLRCSFSLENKKSDGEDQGVGWVW